ncbi:TetR/AcrR family transcriptional regulator [Bradyrhizobium cenepequi]|uniref:TetR/AcrR family transcriptional regulator n=1 Tax=Bradyrhizobium cenepequi TaxID=2821403 RepID=UPI001CE2AC23|nr:TetR/AcrR family transcriptional regulator [Bradyrhizobium cenepequi]MCA6105704.1 TetR/AcrR family transcriptional regulator [Bradyrhizobium cenepequi]
MRAKNSPKSRREEYSEATRQALLDAGRDAFAKNGFQAAGMEAISRAARVTRGAFYHHFEDKKALFDAVVVAMQKEAAARIEAAARSERKIWDRLSAGIEAYLDACEEQDYARIVIQEAQAVLGDARYREIEEIYPTALLIATLRALKRDGELDVEDVDLLSRMIDAMICKIGLLLPHSDDPKKVRKSGQKILATVLESFRKTS